MKTATMDLTNGRPLTRILIFALPLVCGTLFQQLYSFVDTIIVGQCLGTDALGAVGTTYSLNFLILGFVQGACVGFGIPIAQSFGAHNEEALHRYLWNGCYLCLLLSVLFTGVTLLIARPLLQLIRTPEEILDMAVLYISIIFAGIPATFLYNYSASALRAVGDSKHPFYFLLFTSLLNILLDLLFIQGFSMGVEGAAAATVLSQLLSGLLNTRWLLTRTLGIRIKREEVTLSSSHLLRLCIVGLPMGFEYSVSAIGAVIMQDAINALGTAIVAAQTAGEKIRQMFTLPMESVGMAMATYAGQNLGAGRIDRIKTGIRDGLIIQATYCLFAWIALFFIKGWAVALVLGEADPLIYAAALEYLGRMSVLFLIHGSLMIFRNVLQGLGYSTYAIASGIGELIGRALGSLLSISLGFVAICYANPIAWALALCYCIRMLTHLLRSGRLTSRMPTV